MECCFVRTKNRKKTLKMISNYASPPLWETNRNKRNIGRAKKKKMSDKYIRIERKILFISVCMCAVVAATNELKHYLKWNEEAANNMDWKQQFQTYATADKEKRTNSCSHRFRYQ